MLVELAVKVREGLGGVNETIEHHKGDMAKSIKVLREDLADAL